MLRKSASVLACSALREHFGCPLEKLVTATRLFPPTARLDLQQVLDAMFAKRFKGRLLGTHTQYDHSTITMASLSQDKDYAPVISPLQYEEIDAGEVLPTRCLKSGLWLAEDGDLTFAVVLRLLGSDPPSLPPLWRD